MLEHPKYLEIESLWIAIYAFDLLETFPKKKSILQKVKTPRILRDYKDFFLVLSYSASIIEMYTTPWPLNPSLATT